MSFDLGLTGCTAMIVKCMRFVRIPMSDVVESIERNITGDAWRFHMRMYNERQMTRIFSVFSSRIIQR